jgi:hypothetical protein
MSFAEGEWRPTPKQSIFLSLPLTIKEAFFGGGVGGGKSDILLIYGIVHRWHENPRFKQVFMRRTYPELKKEIVPRSREIYPKFGATFNSTDMVWTFPRDDQFGSGSRNAGAMIFLGNCEDENDVHHYDSMEINLFTPDELTSFTEYIYLYIGFTRVRTSDPNLPAIIRAAGMPGGIGHTFTKRRFVDPAPEGNTIIIGRGGIKRFYVHATLLDNKHIDPTYKQSIEALPEAEKRAKLGDWDAYQGQVFDEFRDRQYPDEPGNALHVISAFDIPSWWPRIVIGDWGFAAMTWIGFAAISPSRRVYVYRELNWIKTKIAEWAPYVREFIDKENPKLIRFCKSAGQDRGQEHTIQEQISSALGRSVDLSDNKPGSRVAGKMLIHEYLRWKPKKEIPSEEVPIYDEEFAMRVYRMKGPDAYQGYMSQFTPQVSETNIPKLQIFDTCPILINAIKACSYDRKRVEDIAEFEGDDPIDGLRYLVDAAESYFTTAESEFKRVQAQEELINRMTATGDWTAFYRNMRTVESAPPIQVAKRFHSRRT